MFGRECLYLLCHRRVHDCGIGRRPLYCSNKCRQADYRYRQKERSFLCPPPSSLQFRNDAVLGPQWIVIK